MKNITPLVWVPESLPTISVGCETNFQMAEYILEQQANI